MHTGEMWGSVAFDGGAKGRINWPILMNCVRNGIASNVDATPRTPQTGSSRWTLRQNEIVSAQNRLDDRSNDDGPTVRLTIDVRRIKLMVILHFARSPFQSISFQFIFPFRLIRRDHNEMLRYHQAGTIGQSLMVLVILAHYSLARLFALFVQV